MNISSLIKCKYIDLSTLHKNYFIIPANRTTGILYITENSTDYISGHLRLRGKQHGSYSFRYLKMIDNIFGQKENIIEACNGSVMWNCFTWDTKTYTECDPRLLEHTL